MRFYHRLLLIVLGLGCIGRCALADDALLPNPWVGYDVGGAAPHDGNTVVSEGGTDFRITGGGADIFGASDQFHFVYQSLAGNFSLIARLTSLDNTSDVAKAGVMVRDTLSPSSDFAGLVVTPGHGVIEHYRNIVAPSTATESALATMPCWLKLTKQGTRITLSVAADDHGTAHGWHRVGAMSQIGSGLVYAGLCVTSHNPNALTTAHFDHVAMRTNEGSIAEGVYRFIPVSAPDFWLTAGAAVSEPVGIDRAGDDANHRQKWTVVRKPDGWFQISPADQPNLALTVLNNGTDNGTRVGLASAQGAPAQLWKIVPNSYDSYTISPRNVPGSSLDDFGGNASPMAVIDIWQTMAGDPHTMWTFDPAD